MFVLDYDIDDYGEEFVYYVGDCECCCGDCFVSCEIEEVDCYIEKVVYFYGEEVYEVVF